MMSMMIGGGGKTSVMRSPRQRRIGDVRRVVDLAGNPRMNPTIRVRELKIPCAPLRHELAIVSAQIDLNGTILRSSDCRTCQFHDGQAGRLITNLSLECHA